MGCSSVVIHLYTKLFTCVKVFQERDVGRWISFYRIASYFGFAMRFFGGVLSVLLEAV